MGYIILGFTKGEENPHNLNDNVLWILLNFKNNLYANTHLGLNQLKPNVDYGLRFSGKEK